MTEEFIKKYCLDCMAYRNEGYPDNPEHMCLEECGCSVNLINPTIKEMNKCPIGKEEITMATIKKYKKPCITTVYTNGTNILCSSGTSSCICSESCKYWRSCQIRDSGKLYCLDKKIN